MDLSRRGIGASADASKARGYLAALRREVFYKFRKLQP